MSSSVPVVTDSVPCSPLLGVLPQPRRRKTEALSWTAEEECMEVGELRAKLTTDMARVKKNIDNLNFDRWCFKDNALFKVLKVWHRAYLTEEEKREKEKGINGRLAVRKARIARRLRPLYEEEAQLQKKLEAVDAESK